jgi:hypothetical protein
MAHDPALDKFNTPEARAQYARELRAYAAWLIAINQPFSAHFNSCLAGLYEGNPYAMDPWLKSQKKLV